MLELHYSWVGPACTTNLDDLKNDLVGPVAMEKVIDQDTHRINYWCFANEKTKYQTLLTGKKIRVVSFEECLAECLEGTSLVQRASDVWQLQHLLFATPHRSRVHARVIRDYVTFKEAMSLFLLYAYGGYALDTNTVPQGKNIQFPEPSNFCMIGLSDSVKKFRDADVGVMCASSKDREHAGIALDIFLGQVNKLEKERNLCISEHGYLREENFALYKKNILDVIIDAALLGIKNTKPKKLSLFETKTLGDNFPVVLPALNVIKHYTNSHGAMDRKVIPPLLLAVSTGDIEKVKAVLALTDAPDINVTFDTEKYCNIAAYGVAFFYGYANIAELLIKQGADQSIKMRMWIHVRPSSPVDVGLFSASRMSLEVTTSAVAAPPPAL